MSKAASDKRNSKRRLKGHLTEGPDFWTSRVKKFARLMSLAYGSSISRELEHSGSVLNNPALKASDYESPVLFKHDYMLYNLLRKFTPVSSSADSSRSEKAIAKMLDVDSSLEEVNNLLDWSNSQLYEAAGNNIAILRNARNKVRSILGCCPSLETLIEHASFSGGATSSTPRVKGAPAFKFSFGNPEVTYGCLQIALWSRSITPVWKHNGFSVTSGNRVTTVPKDADIDRPIACEPLYNMWLQKAVGAILRTNLRRVGIDLNYQQVVNQRLARKGSIDGSLATIDLSAASDSVSLGICKMLLPRNWYLLLLSLRSDSGTLPDGTTVLYNKMSSMGNGFTFELETLIFYALTQACEEWAAAQSGNEPRRCSVYGDDIICSSFTVEVLIEVLSLCGFKTNEDKSFWTGPFRESCGKHYFRGTDVTPFYIKSVPQYVTDIFKIANNLRRWADVCGVTPAEYQPAYDYIVSLLRNGYEGFSRPRIPPYMGDGALIGRFDEVHKRFNRNKTFTTSIYVESEAIASERHRDYDELLATHYGLGGYLSSLNSFDQSDIKAQHFKSLEMALDDFIVSSNSTCINTSGEDWECGQVTLRLPGVIRLHQTKVEIVSWLEQPDTYSTRMRKRILFEWFGLSPVASTPA